MKLDPKSTRSLHFFTAQMVRISKPGMLGLAILLIIIFGGMYALVVQVIDGQLDESGTSLVIDFYHDRPIIYSALHGPAGQTAPSGLVWPNSISYTLGCSGHFHLPHRQYHLPVSGFDQGFICLTGLSF